MAPPHVRRVLSVRQSMSRWGCGNAVVEGCQALLLDGGYTIRCDDAAHEHRPHLAFEPLHQHSEAMLTAVRVALLTQVQHKPECGCSSALLGCMGVAVSAVILRPGAFSTCRLQI